MTLRSRGESERGFTLIEILVVLVILGLTAALVVGRGPQHSAGLDVRAAAGRLAQTLRQARGQAIATNRNVAVQVDAARHSVRIGDGAAQALPAALQISWTREIGGRDTATIGFAPDGSAGGGRILLAEGGTRLGVEVDWLTGRVRVIDVP